MTITGHVPRDVIDMWAEQWSDHPSRGLAGQFPESAEFATNCELLVSAEPMHLELNRQTGRVHGWFTVGSSGFCKQNAGTAEEGVQHATPPGRYGLFDGAMASFIATFTVTKPAAELPFTGRSHMAATASVGIGVVLLGVSLSIAGRRRRRGERACRPT